MNTRYTKQKEIILHTLQNMNTHPTILELYDAVHEIDPSIGQATVYRNVSKFVKENLVQKIPTNDGIDHYDGNCNKHYHFVCQKCHRLVDLYGNEADYLFGEIEKKHHLQISDIHILCEGICNECK